VEVSRRLTTVKIRAWGSRKIDALRARLRPAAHDSRRVDGESAGRWHARITRTIVLAVHASALQHAASMPPCIGGSDGATTAITQLYRSAVKLRACANGLAAHYLESQFRASSLAHSKAGLLKHTRGFTMDGVRRIRWILHRRVKSLEHALLKARRQGGTNVLAQLEEADRIADDKGRAYVINLALRRARPRGGSSVADVYIDDDPTTNPKLLADPAGARAELGNIGRLAMAAMRGEGFHRGAHEAWLDSVLTGGESWPELTLDGKAWDVLEAISDERLEATLRKTPSKAVGADGFDVTWLSARTEDGHVVPEAIRSIYFASLQACAA